MESSRQVALFALQSIHQGEFADVALDQILKRTRLDERDRRLVTELVYGSVRRQRTLDALIDQLAKKPAHRQPPLLRAILHLGLYQLRYLNQIPAAAAVNTSVELVRANGLEGLTKFVNGLMRQYLRLAATGSDPLRLPKASIQRLGVLHSYPDWILKTWETQVGLTQTEQLCQWLNQPPHIDLRVNPLRASIKQVAFALQTAGIAVKTVPGLPQALRLVGHPGSIQTLPGFTEGWWMVQDSSAQLVSHILEPQPGETVIDACAAPGGKTLHIAELMQDQGNLWACDRSETRLDKLRENVERLQFKSIRICIGDSRNLPQFVGQADRVLLDAPCSGLGTLHRHADARWRQTPETVKALSKLQVEMLNQAATWVKPGGVLVYATCTLHPQENETVIQNFLTQHSTWQLESSLSSSPFAVWVTPEGWLKVWPHRHDMDGFFIARLRAVTNGR